MLARGRQRVAKQAPTVRVVGRPRPRAGQVLDRLLAHPFAAVERHPQHLRRALSERGEQVPQLHRIHLDRRRGAENDVRGVSGDGLCRNPKQVVWSRGFTPALAPRTSRLVRLVEDDDPERLLRQRAALSLVVAIDDEASRYDADAPGAFRDERRVALLGQRSAFGVEPALLLGRPDRRRHAELVVKLVLPLPDQGRWREDQHRLVVEQRQHQAPPPPSTGSCRAQRRRRAGSAPCRAAANRRRRSGRTASATTAGFARPCRSAARRARRRRARPRRAPRASSIERYSMRFAIAATCLTTASGRSTPCLQKCSNSSRTHSAECASSSPQRIS